MFTGIVEKMGTIVKVERDKSNIHFTVETELAKELQIDQSMAHDGVCLTVVKVDANKNQYVVTAIQETLDKTCLMEWKEGYEVNLERSMTMGERLDGHIVQGHVDQTAKCIGVEETDGSWKFTFEYDPTLNNITVEKGSISVNGTSLTVVDSKPGQFSVAIIPYTFDNTNFHNFIDGTIINIEFDVFGKYVAKLLDQYMEAKGVKLEVQS
ncbi:MAG: riboflavin synthase [Bacteroidetes bacterium]|nr:MAG: riboflavin synthase [Bacteroidota bacterium]